MNRMVRLAILVLAGWLPLAASLSTVQAADIGGSDGSDSGAYFDDLTVLDRTLYFLSDDFIFYRDAERDKPWVGPACDDKAVLAELSEDFDRSEQLYRDPRLSLLSVSHVREVAERDWSNTRRLMARRYCEARAYLSDGRHYRMVYWIRSDEGFAGAGWGVTSCLVGRDLYMAFQPACQGLRPQ